MPLMTIAAFALAALWPRQAPPPDAAPPQEPVRLQHVLAPGPPFAFCIEVDARIAFDEPNDRQGSQMRFRMHFGAEVSAADRGQASIACRLDRIEANVASPAGRGEFDSARHDEQSPLSQLSQLVGQVFKVHVDGCGHIAGVESPAAVSALAKDRLGTDFATLFAAWFVPLPAAPVTIGTTWPAEIALANAAAAGAGSIRVTDRLAAIEHGRARIERTLHLEAPTARAGVRFEAGRGTGCIVFDMAAGRVDSAEFELTTRAMRTDGDEKRPAAGTSTLRVRAVAEGRTTPPALEPDPRPNR